MKNPNETLTVPNENLTQQDFSIPSAPPANTNYPWLYPDFIDVPRELAVDVVSGQGEIRRQGMEAHEARVCLILDVSTSMQNPNKFFYDKDKGNQVQLLINKALALAFLFDDNQKIEVFPFGEKVFPLVVLDRDNFTNATALILKAIGNKLSGATNYAEPVKAVRQYYFGDRGRRDDPQSCSEPPVFALFITDGEPTTMKVEAMNEFRSASHQAIFFKFIALRGEQEDMSFRYLTSIDDHPVKQNSYQRQDDLFFIDNSDLVVLNNPGELTMEKMINEYRPWLIEAKEKHLLMNDPGIRAIDIREEGRVTASTISQNSSTFFTVNKGQGHSNTRVEYSDPDCCCVII